MAHQVGKQTWGYSAALAFPQPSGDMQIDAPTGPPQDERQPGCPAYGLTKATAAMAGTEPTDAAINIELKRRQAQASALPSHTSTGLVELTAPATEAWSKRLKKKKTGRQPQTAQLMYLPGSHVRTNPEVSVWICGFELTGRCFPPPPNFAKISRKKLDQ